MDSCQICGIIALSMLALVGIILGVKKIDTDKKADAERRQTATASTERIASDNTWSLYENERALRIQAETREGIVRNQLARERAKSARLERLLAAAEAEKKVSA